MNENQDQNKTNNVNKIKLQTVKYKIYILFILILSYILRGYLSDNIDDIKEYKDDINLYQEKITQKEQDIKQAQSEIDLINTINENKTLILDCINNNKCDDGLSEKLISQKQLIKSYLLIAPLNPYKMDFDQKKILKNINEFLLGNKNGLNNGELNIITFGIPNLENYDYGIYSLPINLVLEFDNEKQLLSFINNVEDKIDINNPILYKISALNYDIANYQETQIVNVSLNAYFYK